VGGSRLRPSGALGRIGLQGRVTLPRTLGSLEHQSLQDLLGYQVGIYDPRYYQEGQKEWPGVSRTTRHGHRDAMRSRAFCMAFARRSLAVALRPEERERFSKWIILSRAPVPVLDGNLSWYFWNTKRIPVGFARWLVANFWRSFGEGPVKPWLLLKDPSLGFKIQFRENSSRIIPDRFYTWTPPTQDEVPVQELEPPPDIPVEARPVEDWKSEAWYLDEPDEIGPRVLEENPFRLEIMDPFEVFARMAKASGKS